MRHNHLVSQEGINDRCNQSSVIKNPIKLRQAINLFLTGYLKLGTHKIATIRQTSTSASSGNYTRSNQKNPAESGQDLAKFYLA